MGIQKTLTCKQLEIVSKTGLFVVKACPGSGKTFAVAARLAKFLSEWRDRHRGIATISFTNVAWQEIEKYLAEDFGIKTPITYPHFLGTIDSFFNQYIFLPFGHLVMNCDIRPEIIGPPVNNWEPIKPGMWRTYECNRSGCKLNDFTFDMSGNLMNMQKKSHFNNCNQNHTCCREKKLAYIGKGYATQTDSRYFSMKVLKDFPEIGRAIAYRFPVMMMDEAQDTSDVEMKAVELLIGSGLKEVMLIGDPEQAIFEWRDAKPELLEKKYNEWVENSLTIEENWRSSQKICDFFQKISSLLRPPQAMNSDVRDFAEYPKIWGYANQNYEDIIDNFLKHCENCEVRSDENDIAVLVRSRELAKMIQGGGGTSTDLPPWQNEITEVVCQSKFLFDRKQFREAFYRLEKEICRKAKAQPYCSRRDLEDLVSEQGFLEWRKQVYNLLWGLPKTDCLLGEWIQTANERLGDGSFLRCGDLAIKRGQNKRIYAEMSFGSLFLPNDAGSNDSYTIGTVHSVKGRTLDAVLLILKKNAGDAKKYANMLRQRIIDNEELRIVYVGITRARKVLVVAMPESEKEEWVKKFFG